MEDSAGGITRRRFLHLGLLAGAFALLPSLAKAQAATTTATTGARSGGEKGRVVVVPEAAWPQPPSFTKYAARASFDGAAEASKRVRGRKYPVRIRTK